METKKCSKCGEVKPISEFHRCKSNKDGYQYQCKECEKEYYKNNKERIKQYQESNKEHRKQWRKNNEEYIKQYNKQWRESNKEYSKLIFKQWYENNKKSVNKRNREWFQKNKDYRRQYNKQWREDNKERLKKYNKKQSKQYLGNIRLNLSHRISTAIRLSLRNGKNGRHWEELVDYTLGDLIKHLESQFKEGMTWDNYGDWHIDHIKPKSWFNFTSYKDEEFQECWALDNLQPLWARDNMSKGNRYIG